MPSVRAFLNYDSPYYRYPFPFFIFTIFIFYPLLSSQPISPIIVLDCCIALVGVFGFGWGVRISRLVRSIIYAIAILMVSSPLSKKKLVLIDISAITDISFAFSGNSKRLFFAKSLISVMLLSVFYEFLSGSSISVVNPCVTQIPAATDGYKD